MISEKQRKLYITRTQKFIKRVAQYVIPETIEMDATFGHSVDAVTFANRLDLDYKTIKEGDKWGSTWESAWFLLKSKVPEIWAGKNVVAQMDFNGEALVFSDEGLPLQGITHGSIFDRGYSRDIFPLYDSASGGEQVSLWVEAAAFSRFGVNREEDPVRNHPTRHGSYSGKVNKIRLAIFEMELYHLWLDLTVLIDLCEGLPEKSTQGVRILRGLSDAVETFADDVNNATACREILRPLLEQKANASSITAIAVGHAHIDTGWLWPVKETIRKCARTFSNQLDLLEKYPEYIFGASQPAHYAMIKEHYPALYEKIKKAIKSGRWEPQGGMWVEADCNITGGESMVRQFIHGKNFFKDEFDFDVKNLWIPDVFGYSTSMPQIMKRAGVDYFLTQKICWSQFNRFPHTTFNWRGLDGTEVLTHFLPEESNNYNAKLLPSAMMSGELNFREKEVLDEMLVAFGVGNGGGGPKAELIERGIRQKDLEGVPKIKFGRADDFFDRISKHKHELPTWSGELYLENHRGTFTTQGLTKRGNRKLELALRETEYLLSCADLSDYPQEELDGIWKTLLLNQFHDIIPGSSIRKVYDVTEQDYVNGLAACARIQKETAVNLFSKNDESLVLVNSLNIPFTQAFVLPEGWKGLSGVTTQIEKDGTVSALVDIPAQGMLSLSRDESSKQPEDFSELILENELVRYVFSANGEIITAFDKTTKKEFLCEKGNVFTLYEDQPLSNDAWNIDIYYEGQALETAQAVSHDAICNGPVRQGLQFSMTIGQSSLSQKVYLDTNSKRLDFHTEVDWKECHRMLRVAFPTTIQSDQASFDIQYGYVQRNTHRNTSWDMARFEVAAHKYADLSNNNYGVALLNDCKYGYKVLENVIDLNLLRSPTHPDPDADLGFHEFTYSLLPHTGDLIHSNVQEQAIQLNQNPALFPGFESIEAKVPLTVEGQGVTLEVLKKAEKEACIILRLVERLGCETIAKVSLTDANATIVETDLMEWNELDSLGKGVASIPMKPFEIRTFKILSTNFKNPKNIT